MEIFVHWQKPKEASTRNISVTIHLNDAIETPHIVLWRHLLRMYSHLKCCYRELLGHFLVHFSNSLGVYSFRIRSLTVSLSLSLFSPVLPSHSLAASWSFHSHFQPPSKFLKFTCKQMHIAIQTTYPWPKLYYLDSWAFTKLHLHRGWDWIYSLQTL